MNNLIYKLSTYIKSTKENLERLNQNGIEELYNLYQYGSQILKYDINITKEDFYSLFEYVNSVLILRVSEEDCYKIDEYFLKLLMCDAKDGITVDTLWFIQHIWYLYVISYDTEDYKDCIPFIQSQLIKKFSIKENLGQKISRNIYTRILLK